MAERDPRYFKVYQDGDDRELEQKIQQIVESGAAPGIDTVAREGVEEIQRMIENGEIGGGGGGAGVDNVARQEIQEVSAQLADISKKEIDFVSLLRDHNEVSDKIYAKVISDRNIEVMVPFSGELCAHYSFSKNLKDDYIIFNEGKVSEVKITDSEVGRKNYDSKTGTWTESQMSHRATSVGATLTIEFKGTGFDYVHWYDNRGGLLEFRVDGELVNTISTHVNAVPQEDKTAWTGAGSHAVRRIVRGLKSENHVVVVTFIGDDPNHTPRDGAGKSVGFVDSSVNGTYPGYETIRIYDRALNPVKKFDVLQERSNKEFAISITPTGKAYRWIPEHEGIGSAFAVEQKIYFDNKLITDWTPDLASREVKSVQIVQKMQGKHPDMTNPIADILTIHTVNAEGVSVKTKITFLVQSVVSGYGLMFPVKASFGKQLITSHGKRYGSTKTDGSYTDIAGGDNINSYAFVNNGGTNGEADVIATMTIKDAERTLRKGKADRFNPLVRLQHRDATVQKLYLNVLDKYNAKPGDILEASGKFHIAGLPMANAILPNE